MFKQFLLLKFMVLEQLLTG